VSAPPPPRRAVAWAGQGLLFALFALAIGLFSRWPVYRHLPPDQALIRLSIIHHGQRLQACESLDPDELAALPPNMRAPTRCPRERAPLLVELDIDGELAYRQAAKPSGLSGDGAAALYLRLPVATGGHDVVVRLRDSARTEGFDYQRDEHVELGPGQILLVDFDPNGRGITLQ
jgi:hypothetical protein